MPSEIAVPGGNHRLSEITERTATANLWPGLFLLIFFSLGIVSMGAYAASALTTPHSGVSATTFRRFVDGEFLLKFKPGTSAEEVQAVYAASNAKEFDHILGIGVARVQVPTGSSVGELVAWYRKDPHVQYAEANYLLQEGSAADIAAGIVQSADRGAATLNVTYGSEAPGKAVEDAVDYARLKGTQVLAGERGLTLNPVHQ